MSLDRYASVCSQLREELISSLSGREVDELRADHTISGTVSWIQWLIANRSEVQTFVAAAPSRRCKLKKWNRPGEKARLTLAGIQFLDMGAALLDAAADLDLNRGRSYREMSALAGDAALGLWLKNRIDTWPFELPDPFADS